MVPSTVENVMRLLNRETANAAMATDTRKEPAVSFESHLKQSSSASQLDGTRHESADKSPLASTEHRDTTSVDHPPQESVEADRAEVDTIAEVDTSAEDVNVEAVLSDEKAVADPEVGETESVEQDDTETSSLTNDMTVGIVDVKSPPHQVTEVSDTDSATESEELVDDAPVGDSNRKSNAPRGSAKSSQDPASHRSETDIETPIETPVEAEGHVSSTSSDAEEPRPATRGTVTQSSPNTTSAGEAISEDETLSVQVPADQGEENEAVENATAVARESQPPRPARRVDDRKPSSLRPGGVAAVTADQSPQLDTTKPAVEALDRDALPTSVAIESSHEARPAGNGPVADRDPGNVATSRLAQHLLPRANESGQRGSQITDADQTRFVDRVVRAMHASEGRGGTLRLRLSPPELGSLTLQVKVQAGVLTARVEAETPVARSLLLENLPVLRERLAEQGLRVEQFDVDLMEQHSRETPYGPAQDQHDQEPSPRQHTAPRRSDESPEATPSERTRTSGDGRLNIIV